jgi:hypothetical protein
MFGGPLTHGPSSHVDGHAQLRLCYTERRSQVAATIIVFWGCLGGVQTCLESGCPNFIIFVVSLSPSKVNAASVPEITVHPLPSYSFPAF